MRIRIRNLAVVMAVVLPSLMAVRAASAGEVDLSALVNADLSTYYNGSVYPADGGEQTIGGILFDLPAYPGGGTGVIQAADGNSDTYTIPVEETGVTTVYTVANSAFGVYGDTIGSLTFTGSLGATYTYNLTEGYNIRDHATTNYNDVATNIYAAKDYGSGDHLDVQQIVLPAAFSDQTLTGIRFTAVDQGGGDPFLAAITTSTGAVSAAPEPSAWLLMFAGLGGIGLMLRRAKKTVGFRLKDAFSA